MKKLFPSFLFVFYFVVFLLLVAFLFSCAVQKDRKQLIYSTSRIGIGEAHVSVELHVYGNQLHRVVFNGRVIWMDDKQYNEFLLCNPNPSQKLKIKK